MNVVVTGGSGGLGREVVSRLRDRQVRTVAASRRTGFDLATGEGVRAVLADADVVVHAATNVRFRKVDLDGTRRIIRILQERPQPPHLIYVSIVGVDRNPYPYYRAKYACELVLERSGLPVTVVRATQFHTLVQTIGEFSARGPVAVVPGTRHSSPATTAGSPTSWRRWRSATRRSATAGPATWPGRSGPPSPRWSSWRGRPRARAAARLITLPAVGGRAQGVRRRGQPARSGRQDRRTRLPGLAARTLRPAAP